MFKLKKSKREKLAILLLQANGFDKEYYVKQLHSTDAGDISPALHYHRIGWRNGLDPAPWFSSRGYLDRYRDVRDAGIDPFLHYLEYGRQEGRSTGRLGPVVVSTDGPEFPPVKSTSSESDAELAATPTPDDHLALIAANINLDFYRNQIGKVEITTDDAARHYLELGSRMGLDPAPDFSSSGYLKLHPDVAAAGLNPYVHYLATGRTEQRKTLASHIITTNQRPDGKSEWSHYERMRHLAEKVGGAQPPNLSALNFAVTLTGGDLVKAVMGARLRNPAEAEDAPPEISVLIPCLNEAAVTAECLISVFRASIEARLEIILIDNGSTDAFFKGISGHSDIITLSPGMNIGFGPAMNLAAQRASAPYLLLLNNDTQIAPGCVTALRAALIADATRAVVGPKIISFDGRLQEAGVLLEADGTGDLIGFARHPDEPRFNYPRDVEHLSAACTMIPRKLFIDCGGFDPVYAPAYCEDADLSLRLRAMGYRLHYVPDALVAHHLSKTSSETGSSSGGARSAAKAKLLSRNRATLISRWVNELGRFDIRTIAFYLPQYHPIPENDLWWGKGFTEWRNLAKARPNFIGHRQPRYPADLGYYDLRVPEIMDQQAQMARRYGISGFCYYYYRFGDRRLLEMPIETMLASRKPDFPFCLCWANENWSRRWDGMDHDLLVKQKYGEIDAIGFADDVVRYFRDDRYIRVNGSPLILFYRLQEIPNPKRYLGVCRNVWHQAGFSEVMVAMVESFELSPQPRNPGDFGADITVEFPAHGMVHDTPLPVTRSNPHWTGNAHDYRELVHAFMRREEAGFKRIRSVLVGWDTSPRHQDRSFVLQHNTPGAFQAWLEWTYQRTREQNFGEERLVFINAWNEWCEGSYLEPDLDYGHAYLQAVRNAQEAVTGKGQCFVEVR